MGRGYSVIGLINPKSGENVGGVRAIRRCPMGKRVSELNNRFPTCTGPA